jgi:hypothetical protein
MIVISADTKEVSSQSHGGHFDLKNEAGPLRLDPRTPFTIQILNQQVPIGNHRHHLCTTFVELKTNLGSML